MTATDEQRARVAEYASDLRYRGQFHEAAMFEAVLADSRTAGLARGTAPAMGAPARSGHLQRRRPQPRGSSRVLGGE